jgi:CBS domain-containing protein
MGLLESLEDHVSQYMASDFARVGADESIYHAAMVMKEAGSTEAVVTKGESPVGIITERDILYKIVAAGLIPQQVKAKDVMSAPLETIDESAKVRDAIAKMSSLGIRRLGVTRNGKIIGMVTQKAMATGSVEKNIPLPELAPPKGFVCPYCSAITDSREELSKHIDRSHMGGLGLLQGDLSKW